MRFFLAAFLMALVSLGVTYFMPWWTMAIVCFLIASAFGLDGDEAFWGGFFSIAVFWFLTALFKGSQNEQLLSKRMAQLFHMNSPYLFMAIGAVLGGLVGGLAAWSGSLTRRLFAK